jgi:hypothetical protein
MTASLVVLGYGFYISSRMFWVNRSERGYWKYVYFLVSAFIIITYFLFSVVLFAFITSSISPFSFLSIINSVLGVFLLSGAGLIAAIMRYHLNIIGSVEEENVRFSLKTMEIKREKEKLRKELIDVKDELVQSKKLNKLAVGRELRMIELSKRLKKNGKPKTKK